MVRPKEIFFLLLMFFCILVLVCGQGDGPATTNVKRFINATNEIFDKNTVGALKGLSNTADVLAASGNGYAAIMAAAFKFGVSKLDPDEANAFEIAKDQIFSNLEELERRVVKIQNMLPWEALQLKYFTFVSRPFTHLFQHFEAAVAATTPQGAVETIKEGCKLYDPVATITDLALQTQCLPINNQSMEVYIKAHGILRKVEYNVRNDYSTEKQLLEYEKLKLNFFMKLLDQPQKAAKFFEKIQDDLLTDGRIKLQLVIDTLKLFLLDEPVKKDCWLTKVYLGVEHSRPKLENFMNMVQLDAMRSIQYVAICANLTKNGDAGLINFYIDTTVKYAKAISNQMKNFLEPTLEKAWPDVMKEAVENVLGSKPIDKEAMNQTAVNIAISLNERGLEKYEYHSIITDAVEDGYGSAFQCRKDLTCLDVVANNIRVFVIRYSAGHLVTKRLDKIDESWQTLHNTFNDDLQDLPDSKDLLPEKKLFFKEEYLKYWTIIIIQYYSFTADRDDLNFGFENSKYQGQEMIKSLDKYSWHLEADNYVVKVFFVY